MARCIDQAAAAQARQARTMQLGYAEGCESQAQDKAQIEKDALVRHGATFGEPYHRAGHMHRE